MFLFRRISGVHRDKSKLSGDGCLRKHCRKVFTLIEIISALVVISILAATLVPKIGKASQGAEEAMIQNCINELNSRTSQAWSIQTGGGTLPRTLTVARNVLELVFTGAVIDGDALITDTDIDHNICGKDYYITYVDHSNLKIRLDTNRNGVDDTKEVTYSVQREVGDDDNPSVWSLVEFSRVEK